MDPDIVRLILAVLGVLLVAGIYFWDRYRRALPRFRMPGRTPAGFSRESDEPEAHSPTRAEP